MSIKKTDAQFFHHTVRVRLCALLFVAAAVLAACGQKAASSMADYIGIDAAKEAAMKAAGISADQATLLSAGLDSKNGTFYYEVVFQGDGVEYEYDIDALTGVVIEEKHTSIPSGNQADAAGGSEEPAQQESAAPKEEAGQQESAASQEEAGQQESAASQEGTGQQESAASQEGTGQQEGAASQEGTGQQESAASQEGTGQQESAASQKGNVTQKSGNMQQNAGSRDNAAGLAGGIDSDTAFSIALSHAGLKEADVIAHQVKEDIEDGKRVFEVEFMSAGGAEYDYELSAEDGTILSYDYDAESQFRGAPAAGAGIISEDQARQIVLDRVPGASARNMVIELEEDDGRMEYEGKLVYDNTEYEFKVDAYSGGLIEWEAETVRSR